jgi:hypothetical protein
MADNESTVRHASILSSGPQRRDLGHAFFLLVRCGPLGGGGRHAAAGGNHNAIPPLRGEAAQGWGTPIDVQVRGWATRPRSSRFLIRYLVLCRYSGTGQNAQELHK